MGRMYVCVWVHVREFEGREIERETSRSKAPRMRTTTTTTTTKTLPFTYPD